MNIREPLIRDFMTLQPLTIEGGQSVETAKKMMTKYAIRHLPVTIGGAVAGLLSERELNIALGIESMDPKQLLVIDMCTERPYVVSPDTPLREVVDVMSKKHYGSAMVMENMRLVGIFTTVDACRALHDLLDETVEGANFESIRNFRFFLKSCETINGNES